MQSMRQFRLKYRLHMYFLPITLGFPSNILTMLTELTLELLLNLFKLGLPSVSINLLRRQEYK